VIGMPEDCESGEKCDYICDKFIGFDGVQDEAVDLSVLVVDDLLQVDPVAVTTDNDEDQVDLLLETDLNSQLGSDETKLRQLEDVDTSSGIIFTSDETLAYTPDTEENTKDFDVEIPEDPVTEKDVTPVEDLDEDLLEGEEGSLENRVGLSDVLIKVAVVFVIAVTTAIICIKCSGKGTNEPSTQEEKN